MDGDLASATNRGNQKLLGRPRMAREVDALAPHGVHPVAAPAASVAGRLARGAMRPSERIGLGIVSVRFGILSA